MEHRPEHAIFQDKYVRQPTQASSGKPIELEVTLISGTSAGTLHVHADQYVAQVKWQLAQSQGVLSWTQQLLLDGQILQDEQQLSAYIHPDNEKATLVLVRKNDFVPAGAFEGEPDLGYIFKNGEQGLGYYRDEYEDDCFWKKIADAKESGKNLQ
jgi:hypothetical protein